MDTQPVSNWTWWKHGVIYHIYPLSFKDSNDDGYGDIPGITGKLDYLSDLGIDAIWLSPIFKSPMVDWGYDVSDYRAIDPIFGSMKDFKRLLDESHKRGIRVIIDMIMNHTSDQHPWFVDSRSTIHHPKRDWYIWREAQKGKKPNNWKSVFGGSAWQFDERTGQYYLHTFLKEQPDLNWRNKQVKKAFMRHFKFWLDMGVDGFRLDAVNMIVKDKKFRNNPGLLVSLFQNKKWHTRNQPKSYKILRQLRELLDTYHERVSVGEIYTLPPGDSEMAGSYLDEGNNAIHMAFDFSLLFRQWNARKYHDAIVHWYNNIPPEGWPCNVLSNHDLGRSVKHFGSHKRNNRKARILAMLLLTLKGTPFIYYGEEIGMENAYIHRNEIRDKLGKKFWPIYQGRDKARTPMQWTGDTNAGFTSEKPWLPINRNFHTLNVEAENRDEGSLYNFYRKLIALRKQYAALQQGKWEALIKGENGVLAYAREIEKQRLIVLLNFTPSPKSISIESYNINKVLLSTHRPENAVVDVSDVKLFAYEASLLKELEFME
ncbi:MAG: alpha-glucosidase [Bacteroidales bacterium]|nr:alpha-glucosidase [Bacteroidales bacterium]MCF8458816.1 alpha-glucosidase [Bacteroidales bacterium]